MKKYNLTKGDVWISEDIFQKDFVNLGIDNDEKVKKILNRGFCSYLEKQLPEYEEYVNLYGKLNKLDKSAMLIAEGNFKGNLKNRNWVYYDNEKQFLIQDWINSVDGKYHSLLFSVCNPGVCKPISKKSLLFIPDRDIAEAEAHNFGTCYHLYVPKVGIVDGYTIEYELNKLKEKIRAEEGK
jgi:hypothetical protein